MRLLNVTTLALQIASGWTSAAVFLIALVVCCLVMMFMMRMGGRSSNRSETDRPRKKDEAGTGPKRP